MSVGVIVNPQSRRNLRGRNRIEQFLADRPDVVFGRAERFEDLGELIDDFIRREVRAILISGGDGTVQAVQTHLAEALPASRLPRLAILPDGTTNMNAADIGVQNPRSRSILERLSVAEYCVRSTNVKRRHTIRIDNPADGGPRHGMFFGTGAIERAVAMCHRDAHRLGLAGDWATGLTLVQALFKAAFGGDSSDNPDRLYKGMPTRIVTDGAPFASGDQLLVMVTTLHRLILGSRPFWNQDKDALRLTSVAFPPERLLLNVPFIMYGGDRRRLPDSYRSGPATEIDLTLDGDCILDGEIVRPPQGAPLRLSLGPAFEYLCG
jgi:hypothetical protein